MKLIRKFLLFSVIMLLTHRIVFSQPDSSMQFRPPLNIPLFLSGNYGELRTGHFHAGIDIKTMGEIGQPVYSAAEGFISRIKIQAGGYGKSIYVTHPNGFTTVYGHLDRYIPEIDSYVKESQYRSRSFVVDLYPPKRKFEVAKGGLIAYSGNTGSSGGPHLHFEVRKSLEETPLNVMLFNLPISDKVNPEFRYLYVYMIPEKESVGNNGETRNNYPVTKLNDSVFEVKTIVKCSTDYIGFATEIYDFLNGSQNHCGIYTMELDIDDVKLFSFTIDDISFAQTKYINAHMDYELKITENTGINRLFKLPNNKLNIYGYYPDNGIYNMRDDSVHQAVIVAEDAYKNKSVLKFRFQKSTSTKEHISKADSTTLIRYNQEYTFKYAKLLIYIPSGALYRDIKYSFATKKGGKESISDTFYIHSATEPLKSSITLKYTIDSVNQEIKDKLLFARVNEKNELVYEGGEWLNRSLTSSVDDFGKYIITADTTAPSITPIIFNNNQKYYAGQQLIFNVTDNLSGINTYNAYINDKWALLEYDQKTDRMFYTIDKEKLVPGTIYKLKLFVMDKKNNIAVFEGKFGY
jgi:hypothetical protein